MKNSMSEGPAPLGDSPKTLYGKGMWDPIFMYIGLRKIQFLNIFVSHPVLGYQCQLCWAQKWNNYFWKIKSVRSVLAGVSCRWNTGNRFTLVPHIQTGYCQPPSHNTHFDSSPKTALPPPLVTNIVKTLTSIQKRTIFYFCHSIQIQV